MPSLSMTCVAGDYVFLPLECSQSLTRNRSLVLALSLWFMHIAECYTLPEADTPLCSYPGNAAMKSLKPWEQLKSKKKKKPKKRGPADVSKRYTLPAAVVQEIKRAALEYRTQGRLLQIATELLVRMDPLPPPDPEPGESTRMTYRIPQRTANIIDELAQSHYNGDRSQVFSACIKAIHMKKIGRP